ncbi:MAG: hypothetical protein EOP42_31780, partial [Sphingobacteriaceae bacterium]
MKKSLLILLVFMRINAFCQNDDKKKHAIDVDAIRETQLTGDVGLKPTVMSAPATPAQVEKFLKLFSGKKYLTFPEDRANSIRLLDSLPKPWLTRTATSLTSFKGTAQPGEYYVFQIGVYAANSSLKSLNTLVSPLKNVGVEKNITDITCFNTQGVDITGKSYFKTVDVELKKVLPLWFGIQVPENAKGIYKGNIQIKPAGLPPTVVNVVINVKGEKIANHGFDHDSKLSRLAWLNSKVALDKDITNGFKQLDRTENLISILGRSIKLAADGLPEDIETYFDKNNQHLLPRSEPVLSGKIKFIVVQNSKQLQFDTGNTVFGDEFPGATHWTTTLKNADLNVLIQGRAEFDGYIRYNIDVTPVKDIAIQDIRLELPMAPQKSTYMMGLDK